MHAIWHSLWDEPRPPHPATGWRDFALGGVLTVAAVLEVALRPGLPWRGVCLALALLAVPAVVWRRRYPLLMVAAAFTVTGLAPFVTGGEQPRLGSLVFVLLLPFALYRWGSGRQIVLGTAIIVVKMVLSLAFGHVPLSDTVGGAGVLFAACALAAALRYRGKARARELDQARLLERERLARDLHDTVAHHVSAMAIRAQAGLAVAASDPDSAAKALRLIESEASQALAEMRALVHVLRQDEGAALRPSPRVSDLLQLEAGSGPSVEVTICGDVDNVPTAIGTAIYRLAQDSVTNARRHARHATRIEVTVTANESAVRLRVSDNGASSGQAKPGYGLIGMTERATLLGGTLTAGPGPAKGWTVDVVLPT